MGVVPDLVEGYQLVREAIGGDARRLGDLHSNGALDTRQLTHFGTREGYRVIGEVGWPVVVHLMVIEVVVVMAGDTHRLDGGEGRRRGGGH